MSIFIDTVKIEVICLKTTSTKVKCQCSISRILLQNSLKSRAAACDSCYGLAM